MKRTYSCNEVQALKQTKILTSAYIAEGGNLNNVVSKEGGT